MVEVVKIMETFFKRSMDALLNSVPPTLHQATANPHLHWTPGHSQASLGQSLVGSLLPPPESWRAQGFVCALQECFPSPM